MLLFTLLAAHSYKLLRGKRTEPPYPPGPVPKPILGNVFDIPLKKAWKKYMEWSKKFNSDVVHFTAINTHVVVLNKLEDIVELMERRSANSANKHSIPLNNLLGFENTTGKVQYGNTYKRHRRVMEEAMKKDILVLYHHMFADKVHIMLDQFLRDPAAFREHCGMLGASLTLAIAFGYDVTPGLKDHFTEPAEFAIRTATDLAVPGRTMLAVFGFLCYIPPWFPGASTQRLCAKVRDAIMQTREGPYQYVKQRMAGGKSKDCLLARQLERQSAGYEDEELLKDIMASFYFGGVETMKTAQANFILAMTLHPHVQRKAQEEIDRVVGSHRLPSFEDRNALPYVEALYREVHRWRPVFPAGVPHATINDDVYKGYYIPKGTLLMPNIWAVTRNEEKYLEPDSFNPERFFHADGTLNDDTVSYVFGFGRRVCPGRNMADKAVWLVIVSVLATFNISKARDDNGNEIEVDANAYTDGMTSHPLPFKCSIVPRSSQAKTQIRTVGAAARQNLTREE